MEKTGEKHSFALEARYRTITTTDLSVFFCEFDNKFISSFGSDFSFEDEEDDSFEEQASSLRAIENMGIANLLRVSGQKVA